MIASSCAPSAARVGIGFLRTGSPPDIASGASLALARTLAVEGIPSPLAVRVCRDPISPALLDLSYDGRPGVTRLRRSGSGMRPAPSETRLPEHYFQGS